MQHDQVTNESKIGSQKIRNASRTMLHGKLHFSSVSMCVEGKGGVVKERISFFFFFFKHLSSMGKAISVQDNCVVPGTFHPLTIGSLNRS